MFILEIFRAVISALYLKEEVITTMKKAIKQSTLIYALNAGSVLLLTGVVAAFLFMFRMNSDISLANSQKFDLTRNATLFMDASAYLTSEVRAYAVTGDERHYDNYQNEVNNLKNRDTGVANMKEIGITSEEQQKIDEMSGLSNQLVPLEEKAMEDARAARTEQASEYVFGSEYESATDRINEIKGEFLDMLESRTQKKIDRLEAASRVLQAFTFLMILMVAAMQAVTFLVMRKKVLTPIAAVEKEMEEIAHGNLSSDFSLEPDTSEIGMLVNAIHNTRRTLHQYIGDISEKLNQISGGNIDLRVDIQYIGDFSPIQQALETIIFSLNNTLSQINRAAQQVSLGSDQVAGGAQALASGSAEQASSIEELSASARLIAQQAEENSSSVRTAARYMEEAVAGVEAGNEYMKQLTEAMKEIGDSSNQITNITKVIEDIAFQTNILALNAAIEAARAGEAGKGFSVVADEVRSLAAKSGEAARQTTSLIQASVAAANKGIQTTSDTAVILQEVGVRAKLVDESIAKIEQASAEQADAIEQIEQGLNQVSAVVQNNAATAEENSATSEEMSAQAITLRDEIRRFRLSSQAVG